MSEGTLSHVEVQMFCVYISEVHCLMNCLQKSSEFTKKMIDHTSVLINQK